MLLEEFFCVFFIALHELRVKALKLMWLKNKLIDKLINNDLEVAHPQSGSSSTWFLVELEFGNVGFWGGENRSSRRKTSWSKGENQQQTQPTYGIDAGIWTRATLVGGQHSHHCAIPCPQTWALNWPKTAISSWPGPYEFSEFVHFRHDEYNRFFGAHFVMGCWCRTHTDWQIFILNRRLY